MTTLLMDTGSLCNYLEDVLSSKQHPVSSQALFCMSLLICSNTLMSLSVSGVSHHFLQNIIVVHVCVSSVS